MSDSHPAMNSVRETRAWSTSGYLIFVAFIALLPLDTPPVVLLLSGLATGVTMDLAMGAAGVNTIATLLIAFARPTLLGLLYPRDDIREGGIPSTGRLGNRVFLNYL